MKDIFVISFVIFLAVIGIVGRPGLVGVESAEKWHSLSFMLFLCAYGFEHIYEYNLVTSFVIILSVNRTVGCPGRVGIRIHDVTLHSHISVPSEWLWTCENLTEQAGNNHGLYSSYD